MEDGKKVEEQSDEKDMGMSYETLAKQSACLDLFKSYDFFKNKQDFFVLFFPRFFSFCLVCYELKVQAFFTKGALKE